MKFFHTLFLSISAICAFNSCNLSTEIVHQGSIVGRVYLSSSTVPRNESNQSITVTLTGNQSYSTVSADSGKFVFDNVVQGIYTVTYSKTGYVPYIVKNIQFVGNGTLELSTGYVFQEIITGKSTFGYVRLFDENGDSLSDHSGALISIVGTSITAISDKTGAFYFPKYPAGTFDVSFSKSDYQTFVVPNVVFPDSNALHTRVLSFQNHTTVALSKPPKFEVQFDTIVFNYSNNNNNNFTLIKLQDGSNDTLLRIHPTGRIVPTGYGKQIALISVLGDTPDVNIDTYDRSSTENVYNFSLNNPERIIDDNIGLVDFRTPYTRWHVLRAGKEVYVKLYAQWALNDNSLHYFENRQQKRLGMSGYSSTKVMKFTFPTTFKYN